tara:strand:+ start:173050 stop:174966 length:1917 start_codon:yes stop_codon:yes gene_type:complete
MGILKYFGTLVIALVCLALCLTIIYLQWWFVVAFAIQDLDTFVTTLGLRMLVLVLPLCWVPIGILVILALVFRKAWLALAIPVYFLIWLIPSIALRIYISEDFKEVSSSVPVISDDFSSPDAFILVKPTGSTALDPWAEKLLLGGAMKRIVVAVPRSTAVYDETEEQLILSDAEFTQYTAQPISQCQSEQLSEKFFLEGRNDKVCTLVVESGIMLPDYAYFSHTQHEGEAIRLGKYIVGSKLKEDHQLFGRLEGYSHKDADEEIVYRVHVEARATRRSRIYRVLSYVPTTTWKSDKSYDLWGSTSAPVGTLEAKSLWIDAEVFASQLFGAEAFQPTALSDFDIHVDTWSSGGYKVEGTGRKMLQMHPANDWFAYFEDRRDQYLSVDEDAALAPFYNSISGASVALCLNGEANEVTATAVGSQAYSTFPAHSPWIKCREYLPPMLRPIYDLARDEANAQRDIQYAYYDLVKERREVVQTLDKKLRRKIRNDWDRSSSKYPSSDLQIGLNVSDDFSLVQPEVAMRIATAGDLSYAVGYVDLINADGKRFKFNAPIALTYAKRSDETTGSNAVLLSYDEEIRLAEFLEGSVYRIGIRTATVSWEETLMGELSLIDDLDAARRVRTLTTEIAVMEVEHGPFD